MAMLALVVSLATLALTEAAPTNMVRSEKAGDAAIEIDKGAGLMAVDAKQHSVDKAEIDDPCSSLGCNSHKCTWASGEVIAKTVTKKACKNARMLDPKIETLTQCLRAVKTQLVQGTDGSAPTCSPHFEMHMESFQCSCLPVDQDCGEADNEKVCRFQLVNY